MDSKPLFRLETPPVGGEEVAAKWREAMHRLASEHARQHYKLIETCAEEFCSTTGRWPEYVISESWVEGMVICSDIWATDDRPMPTECRRDLPFYACEAYNFGRLNDRPAEA